MTQKQRIEQLEREVLELKAYIKGLQHVLRKPPAHETHLIYGPKPDLRSTYQPFQKTNIRITS
jgi:hypothetical protein